MEEKEYFRLYKIDIEKLEPYGFKKVNHTFIYSKFICHDEFEMRVEVDEQGRIYTQLIDVFSQEEYILHKIKKANGEYISKVKETYEQVLEDIKNNCATKEIYKHPNTKAVISYVKEKYEDELEFLWGEDAGSAVFRRKDVKKWYAIIMCIPKSRLGMEGDEIIEVMNLKGNASDIVDHKHYYLAYHMNKKSWYTIDLTSNISVETIAGLIDKSYNSFKN